MMPWADKDIEECFAIIRQAISLPGAELRIHGDELRLRRIEGGGIVLEYAIASLPREA